MTASKKTLSAILKSPGVQFLGLFGIIALALFWVLATPWAAAGFVQPFTQALVEISAAILRPFDARVIASGDILRFSDGIGAVQVLSGCNAVEVCALLAAAMLAYPTTMLLIDGRGHGDCGPADRQSAADHQPVVSVARRAFAVRVFP